MTSEEILQLSKILGEEYKKEFEEINHFLYENPELGLQEYISSEYLVNYMKRKGFRVEYPYDSFDTAFRAEFGEKGPRIAFLAEYDALPGYGKEKQNAHACGHNWIAAATAGAAVIMSKLTAYRGFRVVLIGTPAEETYCSKVAMAEHGVFKDINLVIQPHLAEESCICPHALAMNALVFEFQGKAAHSSMAPWDGINALDAVQLTHAGINALRQHIKPDTRIHGIVTEGGQAANIVPDKAESLFYIRAVNRQYLDTIVEKVINIARGASLMTGAHLQIKYPEPPMDDLINIPVLQELASKYLQDNGIVPTVSEERAKEIAGSTDIGNVSHVCPTLYMEIGLDSPEPFMAHEETAIKYVDSPFAYQRLHQTIQAMVAIAMDIIESPEKMEQVQREFREIIGNQ